MTRLLAEKKLSLVIDLDQTILHATVDPVVEKWAVDPNSPNYVSLQDVIRFQLPESSLMYFVKLRPGLLLFLEKMAKYFELHIYTMGTRIYAAAIVKAIDPDQSLFQDRVLAREDNIGFHKDLKRIFPCDDSMVVVIDDRMDVWKWAQNILPVKPYNFFVTGDFNAPDRLANPGLFGGIDQHAYNLVLEDNDIQLNQVEKILMELHYVYYSEIASRGRGDVKKILNGFKETVLRGVCLFFGSQNNSVNSDMNIRKLAESFGAIFSDELTASVTNVLVSDYEMVQCSGSFIAMNPGCKFVRLSWLLDSIYSWRRLPETEEYLIAADRLPRSFESIDFEAMNQEVEEFMNSETDEQGDIVMRDSDSDSELADDVEHWLDEIN